MAKIASAVTEKGPAAQRPPAGADIARTDKFRLRRAAILRSAVEVLNHKGVKGMTLANVAATLDLVPTGVIYYFKGKEELAAACFLKAIEVYGGLIEEAARGATARERLAFFVRRYFDFRRRVAIGEVDDVAVFNDVRALGDPEVNEAFTRMFRAARSLIEPDPPATIERAALNARTHHMLSQLFWAVVWLPRYDPEDYARAGERALDILESGIGATGQVWAPCPLSILPEGTASEEIGRETFLRAATELINQQGYLGASVEKISARLNVTKGSFYHHNEAKDDLVVACFERTVEIMRRAQRAADHVGASGWEKLSSTAAALVAFQAAGNVPFLRTSALTCVPEAMQARLICKFDHVSGYFAAMISDGIADGSLRPVDASIAAQMITCMLNSAAELGFWARGLTPRAASAVFPQPVFEGMRAPVAEAGG